MLTNITKVVSLLIIFNGMAFADLSNLKLKGSFRYRNQLETRKANASRSLRQRHRIQLNFGFHGKIHNYTKLGFELASGSTDSTDRVSTNQTLSGAFSTKGISLNQVYIQHWFIKDLSILAGKYKNPFRTQGTSLVYDSDLRPEGLTLQYKTKFGKTGFYAQAALYQLTERESSNPSADLRMTPIQVGANINKLFDIGVGVTKYPNLKGRSLGADEGNDVDSNDNYINDFTVVDTYGQFSLGKAIGLPLALKLIGNFVSNVATNSNKMGFLAGVQIGNSNKKKVGTWQVKTEYQKLESNAVLGAFTDSDFQNGGTDNKGLKISGKVTIRKGFQLGSQLFFTTDAAGEPDSGKSTYQFDAKWIF